MTFTAGFITGGITVIVLIFIWGWLLAAKDEWND